MTKPDFSNYVHGYSKRETERLYDQAGSVQHLIHHELRYPPHSKVLEAGCGVGAQTVTLSQNSPEAHFYAIDWSGKSLELARETVIGQGITNVEFCEADLFNLPFEPSHFDHLFICHLLEHQVKPELGLKALCKHLKPGGSVTVFEGDHGSCYFYPPSEDAQMAWNCLIEVQRRLGANSLIGRELFPLMSQVGFTQVRVEPQMVYIDQSHPELMESFVHKTIIPMVEGVKTQALEMDLIDESSWHKGISDLHRIRHSEMGIFCYTFFKGNAIRQSEFVD